MKQEKNPMKVINFDDLPVSHSKPMFIGESIYDENGKEIMHILKRNPDNKD